MIILSIRDLFNYRINIFLMLIEKVFYCGVGGRLIIA